MGLSQRYIYCNCFDYMGIKKILTEINPLIISNTILIYLSK